MRVNRELRHLSRSAGWDEYLSRQIRPIDGIMALIIAPTLLALRPWRKLSGEAPRPFAGSFGRLLCSKACSIPDPVPTFGKPAQPCLIISRLMFTAL
jgi:hypothetical protein